MDVSSYNLEIYEEDYSIAKKRKSWQSSKYEPKTTKSQSLLWEKLPKLKGKARENQRKLSNQILRAQLNDGMAFGAHNFCSAQRQKEQAKGPMHVEAPVVIALS